MKRRGAAMVWACLLLLIGSLIVGTLTTLGISYHTRSMDEAKINQAYLTARSGAEAVADSIKNQTETGKNIATSVRNDSVVNIADMKFDPYMGKCSVEITPDSENTNIPTEDKKEGRFTISSTATKDGFTETVDIVVKETENSGSISDIFLGQDQSIEYDDEDETIWEWEEDDELSGDDMPNFTAPQNAEVLSKTSSNHTVGKGSQPSYYVFKKGKYMDCAIEQDMSAMNLIDLPGNIYIYVENDASVTIKFVQWWNSFGLLDGKIDNKPIVNVFIFVEDGGELILNFEETKPSYVYIYTKSNKSVKIKEGNDNGFYGGITCYEDDDIHLKNVKVYPGYPQDDKYGGGPSGSAGGYSYDIINYGN